MLDHEERFLFREEIHNLANALADPGQLDNVEDLLAEVTTSPRFDADVFTLERSLQVMLGRPCRLDAGRPADRRPRRLRGARRDGTADRTCRSGSSRWRARFGLVIDNALNFLNNPDGIQGHNFGTQLSHTEAGLTLQGRLTLVRYNNEPQFFIADADVLFSVAADMLERLGEHLEPEMIDADLVTRLREGGRPGRAPHEAALLVRGRRPCQPSASSWRPPARTAARRRRASACWPPSASAACVSAS